MNIETGEHSDCQYLCACNGAVVLPLLLLLLFVRFMYVVVFFFRCTEMFSYSALACMYSWASSMPIYLYATYSSSIIEWVFLLLSLLYAHSGLCFILRCCFSFFLLISLSLSLLSEEARDTSFWCVCIVVFCSF